MSNSQKIFELLKVSESSRKSEWEKNFLKEFPKSHCTILEDQVKQGPDGWPYLWIQVEPLSEEPVQDVLDWACKKGVGLAVNPQKQIPDYIFTYGMVWNFKKSSRFLESVDVPSDKKILFEKGDPVYTKEIDGDFLPTYARNILREFLFNQGIQDQKFLLISRDRKHYDLCFSLESMNSPQVKEHQGILEALSWFLPQHYSIALISEKNLPPFSVL